MDVHDPRVVSPVKLILALSPVLVLLAFITPGSEYMAPLLENEPSDQRLNQVILKLADFLGEYPFLNFLFSVPLYALSFKWAASGKMPFFRALVFCGYTMVAATPWFWLPPYLLYWVYGSAPLYDEILYSLSFVMMLVPYVFFNFGYRRLQGQSMVNSFFRTVLSVIFFTLSYGVVLVLAIKGIQVYLYGV